MSSSHRDAHPYGRSADEVRRRDRRLRRTRRLRVTQLVVFSALTIALIAIGAYAIGEFRRPAENPGTIAPEAAGTAEPELVCPEADATPLPPGDVALRVLNGTSRNGLAGGVAEDLTERGYEVSETGNTDQASGPVTIIYGPQGYLAAVSVAAQVASEEVQPTLRMDESKPGAEVDLLLGDGFSGLVDEDAAAAALEQPAPVPEGC